MNNLLSEKSKELLKQGNCFDFIRYFFAISLIIVHFCTLANTEQFWIITGQLRIKAFFIMSGFLVFYSYIKRENLKDYIEKRVRRILPPYLLVVIFCVVLGFFITNLSKLDYIASKETYKYLLANLSFLNFIQPTLPGVFESNPISAVNGSLWTMKVEVMFYVSVPIILYLLKRYRKLLIMISIFVFALLYDFCFTILYEQTNNELYLLIRKQIGSQLMYFYSGTFILLYFDKFIKYLKYVFPIAIIVYFYQNSNILFSALEPLAFATILVGIAYNIKYLNFLRKYDNITYGMYLYHYPIIQTIIFYDIQKFNIYLAFFLAFFLTILISILSWKYIEKPIINQKYKCLTVPR